MRYSVVIPMYNASATIERALDSVAVQALGHQMEIVLVNDGSTDDGPQRADAWHQQHSEIRYQRIDQENQGLGAARNAGLAHAHGAWICFLDADDYWLPGKLQALENQLGVDHQTDWWVTPVWESGGAYKRMRNFWEVHSVEQLMTLGNPFVPSATAIRKKVLDKLGGFDEKRELMGTEDLDLWTRLLAAGVKPRWIHQPLTVYDVSSGMSADLEVQRHKVEGRLQHLFNLQLISNDLRKKALNRVEYEFARAHHKQGDWEEARSCYRRVKGKTLLKRAGLFLVAMRIRR